MPIGVRSRRQRWLVDGAASFLVYLLPLAGGHSVFLTGEYLVGATARRAGHAATWAASDWAAVLVAQAALLLVLRLARRGPAVLHVLAAISTLVGLTVVLNGLLLVAIPLRYLAESSTAPEVNTLTEVCYVDDVYLQPTTSNLYRRSDAAAVVVGRVGGRTLALLRLPDCAVQDLDVPMDADIAWVSSAGALLWRTREAARGDRSAWNLTISTALTRPLAMTIDRSNTVPTILDDGRTVAWVEGRDEKRIMTVDESGEHVISLVDAPRGSYQLLGGSGPSGPFLLSVSADQEQWITVDAAGRISKTLLAPAVLSRFSHRVHPLPDGWIGWDTYREEGPVVLSWSVAGRTMTRELPKGLGFTSVALDEAGQHIAISATSGLNIGSQRDEVWLIRVSDGAELFRRYGPKYSRSIVALPTGRFLAADEIMGIRPAIRVYSIAPN